MAANLLVRASMCVDTRSEPGGTTTRRIANRYSRRPTQLDITGSPTRAREQLSGEGTNRSRQKRRQRDGVEKREKRRVRPTHATCVRVP